MILRSRAGAGASGGSPATARPGAGRRRAGADEGFSNSAWKVPLAVPVAAAMICPELLIPLALVGTKPEPARIELLRSSNRPPV